MTYLYSYGTPIDTMTDTVVSIDSTIINGVYHKIFNMQNIAYGSARSYTVLEGVGCTNNPVFPVYFTTCFEYGESLFCFSQHDMQPEIHAPINSCAVFATSCGPPLYSFDNSGCAGVLSIGATSKQMQNIAVSPNPATDHINITSDRPFVPNTFITVYDMSGRSVFRTLAEQQNSLTINTSEWIDGLYMIIIQDNSGIIKKEKMVVQH